MGEALSEDMKHDLYVRSLMEEEEEEEEEEYEISSSLPS